MHLCFSAAGQPFIVLYCSQIMRRPIVVTVIAAFLLVATLIALMVATTLIFPGTPLDKLWEFNRPAYAQFRVLGTASGILLLLLGLVTAAAATGLVRGRRWSWWLAISIFAINGTGDVVGLVVTRDVVRSGSGALIAAGFIFCLLRKEVRLFFDQRGAEEPDAR